MDEKKFIDAGSSGEWGWHATELAMKCPQAFAYNYRVKWSEAEGDGRPVRAARPKGPLLRGSLVHAGLAHLYARMRDGADAWATPEEAIDRCAVELGEGAAAFVPMAKSAVRAYGAHYLSDRLVPLHVEEVFAAEIGGWKFTQRLDLVARDATGKVVIIDHKCVSMIGKDAAPRYTLSGQFLGMAQFGRAVFGSEFGGVLVNLLEVRDRDGHLAFSFRRVPVDPAPNALRLFPLTVKHARDRVAALDAAGIDPMEWPKALSETVCVSAYGPCEWFETCRWGG